MRRPIKIGAKEYKTKKEALTHYRAILNSYDYGESLNNNDFDDLLDLLDFECLDSIDENEIESDIDKTEKQEMVSFSHDDDIVEDIKVSKVQFNTKCFEVFYNDKTSEYISYIMIINDVKYSPEKMFYVACRNAVHQDIKAVKQEYFDTNSIKGQVKCQETGVLSKWTELAVDHRQPNTFSVIVDRFIEVNKVELDKLEFTSDDQNFIVFKDEGMREQFKDYHKEKASLRVVRKECNSSRTGLARIKRSSKDLRVK